MNVAPDAGYLVVVEPFDVTELYLSPSRLPETFLLDGANGPALNRCLEAHEMPGGFSASEWFELRDLSTVRFPTLRTDVADALGYERLDRFSTAHYAQYNPHLGLPALLVNYLVAFHKWRASSS